LSIVNTKNCFGKHLLAIVLASILLSSFGIVYNAFAQSQIVPVIILFNETVTSEDSNLVQSVGGEITRTYQIINGLAVLLPQDEIAVIKNDPRVASVDPDVEVHAFDLSADTQIRADQVWAKGDTGTEIPVAILDTGIDTSHPEFSGRILKCHSEITKLDTCVDGNGHGTHTAGIAAAAGANLQAKGVAPSASLYIDQVLGPTGSGTLSGVIAGIDWARINGAKVISMSLGTSPISTTQPNCDTAFPSLTSAVNNAVAAGVSVVAAAGNAGVNGVGAPGCISSTIAVGAVNSSNKIASFSSRGGPLADHGIVAPGVNIYSSVPLGGYTSLSGTSMATPHVAGTIALMLKSNPSLSPTAIRNILFNTACSSVTSPSCPTGAVPNPVYGHGRVDALAAFNAATPGNISKLTVNTHDTTGTTITGYYTVLYQNGNQIATGFSPATFTLNNGQTYQVAVADYGKYVFDHWSDGTTARLHGVSTGTGTTTSLVAVYRTTP